MNQGDTVSVMDIHDNTLVRVVVAIEDGFAYVSRAEEVKRAREDGREPNCIGFPLSNVEFVESHK